MTQHTVNDIMAQADLYATMFRLAAPEQRELAYLERRRLLEMVVDVVEAAARKEPCVNPVAAPDIFARSILGNRIRIAMNRLRIDIRTELYKLGVNASDEAVQKIIDGLSDDVLAKELSRRT